MPASTRLARRSLQVASMIRSTSRLSISPTGCSSALRRSASSFRATSSSPGRRISCERSPCFVALRLAVVLPSGVLGPLLLRAFRLLASICFLLAMLTPFHSLCVGDIKEIVLRRRTFPKRKTFCATWEQPEENLRPLRRACCGRVLLQGSSADEPVSSRCCRKRGKRRAELTRHHSQPNSGDERFLGMEVSGARGTTPVPTGARVQARSTWVGALSAWYA